jgi:hypothetical protein
MLGSQIFVLKCVELSQAIHDGFSKHFASKSYTLVAQSVHCIELSEFGSIMFVSDNSKNTDIPPWPSCSKTPNYFEQMFQYRAITHGTWFEFSSCLGA